MIRIKGPKTDLMTEQEVYKLLSDRLKDALSEFERNTGLAQSAGCTISHLTEQPAPVHADGDVWAEIIEETAEPRLRALFIERRSQGIARYGTPLQRENGRDHSADAIQELVDAVVYFRAAGRRKAQSLTETILIYVLNGHDMERT